MIALSTDFQASGICVIRNQRQAAVSEDISQHPIDTLLGNPHVRHTALTIDRIYLWSQLNSNTTTDFDGSATFNSVSETICAQ